MVVRCTKKLLALLGRAGSTRGASRRIQRQVSGPDGRDWVVRSYRFRRPPWRSFAFDLLDDLEDLGGPGFLLAPLLVFLVALPLGIVTVVILPSLAFLVELPTAAIRALLSSSRFVEAVHPGPPRSRMSWRTSAELAEAVVDQVARQLALGYQRVQPHRAEFLGFG